MQWKTIKTVLYFITMNWIRIRKNIYFDSSNLFFLVTSNTRLISMFSHEIEGIFRNTKS